MPPGKCEFPARPPTAHRWRSGVAAHRPAVHQATKYDAAVYIIRRAYALYPFEELAFSFNGGKDSTVLLHLLRAGYYLHRTGSGHVESTLHTVENCPMRTIDFEDPNTFPEIDCFTYEMGQMASTYGLPLETSIRTDYRSGLEALFKEKPTKAIFLGTRNGQTAIPMR